MPWRGLKCEASLKEDDTIELEAAQWVVSRMNEESFDREGFDAWLAGDPRRKPLFDTMWRRIMGRNMDQVLNAYRRQRQSRRVFAAGSIACMLVLLGGYQAQPLIELFLAAPTIYAATDGAIREVRLDDGTQLMLASGAEVHVRYTRHRREVTLTRGTIFADVSRDENRKFHVKAGDGEVSVLGTRFEVAMKPAVVRVTVEEGKVRFGRDSLFSSPLELGANETASLSATALKRNKNASSRRSIARWRAEWAEYDNAPLSQVVTDLESVSPLSIVIGDSGLADRRVSGRIRLTDPMKQVQMLSVMHAFKIHRNKDTIILSSD